MIGPVHTVTNTWEPDRNVLASKQNKVRTDIISKYDYAVNATRQRTSIATSGTAFPATPSWLWGYDSLGQVTTVGTTTTTTLYDAQSRRIAVTTQFKFPDKLKETFLPSSDSRQFIGTDKL